MNKKQIYTIISTLLISSSIFAGGGWPKKKNSYYLKLAAWYISANENFSAIGDKNELVTQGLFNINLYGEYGITDRLTAIAYIPFFARSFENELIEDGVQNPQFPGRDLNSFGDSEIGIKYGLLSKGKISWTASVFLGLPLGDSTTGIDKPLPTGDGEFNQIIRSDLGISLYDSKSTSVYANVYGGINIRSKDFSEEIRTGAEIGAGFFEKKLWLIAKFDTIQSLNNGDRNFENSGGSLFANNFEVTNLSPEIAYYFTPKIGFNASASFPLSGQFAYSDPSFSAGIFLDIQ